MSESSEVLAPLREAVADAKEAKTASERAAVASRILKSDMVRQIAEAHVDDPDAVADLLLEMEATEGFTRRAAQIRKRIHEAARVVDRVTGATTPISELLKRAPADVKQLCVPCEYKLNNYGVKRMRIVQGREVWEVVCLQPLLPTRMLFEMQTGHVFLELAWMSPLGWRRCVLPRDEAQSSRAVTTLAKLGAPVNTQNAPAVVDWIAAMEQENLEVMERTLVSSSMGWVRDDDGNVRAFALADGSVGERITLAAGARSDIARGFGRGGTMQGWLSAIQGIEHYPPMLLMLWAAAASVVVGALKLPSFVVDLSGDTSTGKTTTLKLAASAWGVPDLVNGAMFSWHQTATWQERAAGTLGSVPLILDDTKNAKYPSALTWAIFHFASGTGKGRGSVEGTRSTLSWRSVLLSSGEYAITSAGGDSGGAHARVLCVRARPMGRPSHDTASWIDHLLNHPDGISTHYGHLGPAVAQWMYDRRDHWDTFKAHILDIEERLRGANVTESPVITRMAKYVAILEFAGAIVHELGVPFSPQSMSPTDLAMLSLVGAAPQADTAMEALIDIVAWSSANQVCFYGRAPRDGKGRQQRPFDNWSGAWSLEADWAYVAFRPDKLRSVLTSMGRDPGPVIDRWHARGWLIKNSRDGKQRTVRIEGTPTPCYCIKREVYDEVIEKFGDPV